MKEISGKELNITDTIQAVDSLESFIKPYRERIKAILDEPLAYNPKGMAKNDGGLNSAIGNFMADIVYEESNPVFKKRTGKDIDFVLLNHGGIRAVMSKGIVNQRVIYQIMPFENTVVVIEMTHEKLNDLIAYLAKYQVAHPISKQLQLVLNHDNSVKSVLINGKPIDKNKTYYVATSNYLADGGDHMDFFANPVSKTELDYLIRNQMIDHLEKIDTIKATTDNRFIKNQSL
ncbi:5'-nucleotidase [Galbibacter sp. EGI 63066]|nr:5'-nucleotidase [Galbibacter sp. EGI 63066]